MPRHSCLHYITLSHTRCHAIDFRRALLFFHASLLFDAADYYFDADISPPLMPFFMLPFRLLLRCHVAYVIDATLLRLRCYAATSYYALCADARQASTCLLRAITYAIMLRVDITRLRYARDMR